MKTLIIAEKPSQMRDYAKALGGFTQKGDFYEKDNYILYCAWGHLVELAEDTAYRSEGKWDKSYLPILPALKDFVYEPKRNDKGRAEQLEKIGKLLNRPDIGMIYVATDSDREGELIFRYIYNYFKCKIPFKRVWVSSLKNEAIRQAFANPKYKQGDAFLENLCKSGYVRVIADWLIGVNATQSATLQLGQGNLLSIGRVQTAILKIICDRYKKNKAHQKTYTYKIITEHSYNGKSYTTESPIFESQQQAQTILQGLLPVHTFVSFEKKTEKQNPPLLHTLDSLTIVANKLYKYDASQVLASAQKLYEGKLISYPRTEDPYITEEGYKELKGFFNGLVNQYLGVSDFAFSTNPKSVDGSKITGSHDALVPTGQTAGIDGLAQQERRIYDLILWRCLESFSETAIYEKGTYLFENKETPFKTHTSKLIQEGWKRYTPKNKIETDEEDKEDEEIFTLELPYKQGDKINVEKKTLKEIESKPPAIYTPATLIADLSNLAKFLQEQSPEIYNELQGQIDLKGLEIGTKGTRPNIIDQLVNNRKFVAYEKNKYVPTPLGLQFYEIIKDLEVVNVSQTARLEYQLKQVQDGVLHAGVFHNNLLEYVKNMVQSIFSLESKIKKEERTTLGICPKCKKGNIIEGKKAFGCTSYKEGCNFTIWKEIAGKTLTEKQIKDLLSKGRTGVIKGFKSKAGKPFEAILKLENFEVKFEFAPNKAEKNKK